MAKSGRSHATVSKKKMKHLELFGVFKEFLARTSQSTKDMRKELISNSFLYPIRCHPNCFPQGRDIILTPEEEVVKVYLLVCARAALALGELAAKVSYRFCITYMRTLCTLGERRCRDELNEPGWLLVDHAATIGGRHSKSEDASGYFPFIETLEVKGLCSIRRVYHISELKRFTLEKEKRVTSMLGVVATLLIVNEQVKRAIRLVKRSKSHRIGFSDRVGLYGAAISQVSFKTLESIMIGLRVRMILQGAPGIGGVITTFEGHSYEREVSRVCEELGVVHVAYQHSPFLKTQYAVKMMKGISIPGVMLFSSRAAFKEMKRSDTYRQSIARPAMVLVGSSEGCYGKKVKSGYFSPSDIVGLPNGDDKELILILKAAEELIGRGRVRALILRCHPMTRERHIKLAKRFERTSKELGGRLIVQEDNTRDEVMYRDCFYALCISSSAALKLTGLGIAPITVGKENSHLSPFSSSATVSHLFQDDSEAAYRRRLHGAQRDFEELYSRPVAEKLLPNVLRLLKESASIK